MNEIEKKALENVMGSSLLLVSRFVGVEFVRMYSRQLGYPLTRKQCWALFSLVAFLFPTAAAPSKVQMDSIAKLVNRWTASL